MKLISPKISQLLGKLNNILKMHHKSEQDFFVEKILLLMEKKIKPKYSILRSEYQSR